MRGQITIINLVYILALLFVVAATWPLINQALNMLLDSTTDPIVKILIGLVPLLLIAGVLNTIHAYSQPGGYWGR